MLNMTRGTGDRESRAGKQLARGRDMVQTPWRPSLATDEDDRFMRDLADDTEDAPWMTMGDLQFWSASAFAHSLLNHARQQRLGWYVAAMLPILYRWPGVEGKKQLAPDTMVAFVPDHPRTSYDLEAEGVFPPFVLEVISPSSVGRDQDEKRRAYDLLGAREYALFRPHQGQASTLRGYRRSEDGQFEPWWPDARKRLWSDVLGLYLVVRGTLVQAETPEGRVLLTPEQSEVEREREATARQQADLERATEAEFRRQAEAGRAREAAARQRAEMERAGEAAARQRAEMEVARLRRELERIKGPDRSGDGAKS